jgi:hypothetical protein
LGEISPKEDLNMSQKPFNPFEMAQRQLDEAAELLQLDPAVHELLRYLMRELRVTLPVKMDDGSTKLLHGFRVQYNDARGPNKGGIRFHSGETIDTVRALAARLPWKIQLTKKFPAGLKPGSSSSWRMALPYLRQTWSCTPEARMLSPISCAMRAVSPSHILRWCRTLMIITGKRKMCTGAWKRK